MRLRIALAAALAPLLLNDGRGNRTAATRTVGNNAGVRTEFPGNAANQITASGYTYDAAGNMTTAPASTTGYHGTSAWITYNAGSQMSELYRDGGWDVHYYTYAGAGNNELLTQTGISNDNSYSHSYSYGRPDTIGKPVIEQVSGTGGTAHLENDATGHPILLRDEWGVRSLYIYDNLGSPVALINETSTAPLALEYDPFGAASMRTAPGRPETYYQNPYTFTGGVVDRATGWVLNGARWYSPQIGRWTQHDTLDAPLDPLNANRYAYAANNPVNYIDPTGSNVLACIGGWLGMGASAVSDLFSLASFGKALWTGAAKGIVVGMATMGLSALIGAALTMVIVSQCYNE